MITIIDYNLGNPKSIKNMLKKIGFRSIITSDIEEIKKATKLILPGVGAFDKGMSNLKELGIIDVLNSKVLDENIPFLGVCLGMQLIFEGSEEGSSKGLGWVKGNCIEFPKNNPKFPVPNMGWLEVNKNQDHFLIDNLDQDSRFYFVHSYFVQCNEPEAILLRADYNMEFTAGVVKNNIVGFQFHPEKSHRFGMQLLNNFATWNEKS